MKNRYRQPTKQAHVHCLLHHSITTKPPFQGVTPLQHAYMHIHPLYSTLTCRTTNEIRPPLYTRLHTCRTSTCALLGRVVSIHIHVVCGLSTTNSNSLVQLSTSTTYMCFVQPHMKLIFVQSREFKSLPSSTIKYREI